MFVAHMIYKNLHSLPLSYYILPRAHQKLDPSVIVAEGVDGTLLLGLTAEDMQSDLGLSSLQTKKVLKNIEYTQSLTNGVALDGEPEIVEEDPVVEELEEEPVAEERAVEEEEDKEPIEEEMLEEEVIDEPPPVEVEEPEEVVEEPG